MELSGLGYKCSHGETFDSVAINVYGDEKYAAEIMCANPEQCGKTVFDGGEDLYLPAIDMPTEEDVDMPMQETAPWRE